MNCTFDPVFMQAVSNFAEVPGFAFTVAFLWFANRMQRREAFENKSISFRRAMFINSTSFASGTFAIVTFAATIYMILSRNGGGL